MSPVIPTPNPGSAGGIFATTHWTAVLAAGRGQSRQADIALEELCRSYWYPLYAYVRRRGHSREDAEDSRRGFSRVSSKQTTSKASPATKANSAHFCSSP